MAGEVRRRHVIGFAIPCTMRRLRWWIAVQSVYARSIGESFARPMNDNALARGVPW